MLHWATLGYVIGCWRFEILHGSRMSGRHFFSDNILPCSPSLLDPWCTGRRVSLRSESSSAGGRGAAIAVWKCGKSTNVGISEVHQKRIIYHNEHLIRETRDGETLLLSTLRRPNGNWLPNYCSNHQWVNVQLWFWYVVVGFLLDSKIYYFSRTSQDSLPE